MQVSEHGPQMRIENVGYSAILETDFATDLTRNNFEVAGKLWLFRLNSSVP